MEIGSASSASLDFFEQEKSAQEKAHIAARENFVAAAKNLSVLFNFNSAERVANFVVLDSGVAFDPAPF